MVREVPPLRLQLPPRARAVSPSRPPAGRGARRPAARPAPGLGGRCIASSWRRHAQPDVRDHARRPAHRHPHAAAARPASPRSRSRPTRAYGRGRRFRDYRAAGVNRLSPASRASTTPCWRRSATSIGGEEARRDRGRAQPPRARVNLDLVRPAWPDPGHGTRRPETAIGFGVQHPSCYHLTLEPNTLPTTRARLPGRRHRRRHAEAIEACLAAAGFTHQTSAFARPHEQSRHNLNYWTFGDYLGLGPGAHGKLSSHEGIRRDAPQAPGALPPKARRRRLHPGSAGVSVAERRSSSS